MDTVAIGITGIKTNLSGAANFDSQVAPECPEAIDINVY